MWPTAAGGRATGTAETQIQIAFFENERLTQEGEEKDEGEEVMGCPGKARYNSRFPPPRFARIAGSA